MEQDQDIEGLRIYVEPVPVSLLTGFLGSGKTTVLNHLLRQPEMARTAVIINEFGAIGLDHELVVSSTDTLVLLQSGCLCCTIRGDLRQTLQDLVERCAREEIPSFDRVIIETTGLADPAPILHTLITDDFLSVVFHLDGVIVTVDAVNGPATLDAQMEAIKQVAVADRLLLTKTDLVGPAGQTLERRLRRLNPGAPILKVCDGVVDPKQLFGVGLFDFSTKSEDVERWINAEAYSGHSDHAHGHDHDDGDHEGDRDDHSADHHDEHGDHHHHHHDDHDHDINRHDASISAAAFTFDAPIAPSVFDLWIEAMMLMRGQNILRLKGIVHVEGVGKPFVIHGVQHIFHPPVVLEEWSGTDHRTRIVIIGRDLESEFVQEGFRFLRSGSVFEGNDRMDEAIAGGEATHASTVSRVHGSSEPNVAPLSA